MHPGERVEELNDSLLRNIDSWLQWDRITGFPIVPQPSSTGSKMVSLWKWCYVVLVDSATRSMFGEAIFNVYPDVLENFYSFDEEGWKLPYKLPEFAAKKLYRTLARSKTAFGDFLALPKEQRQDSSWIVKQMEDGLIDLGVEDPAQCGVMLLSLHRLTNSNAHRGCFWALTYLLHDESLLELIRDEIRPAFTLFDAKPDMAYLLGHCPLLASFYEEVIRLTVDPIAVRVATDQVTVGGKVLQPGRKILAPFRQMHFNPEVYGSDANDFSPRRFANNPKLQRSTSWRPFGGGNTHCPGRFIARREVYMFIAIVIFRFEVKLAPGADGKRQKFPVLDTSIREFTGPLPTASHTCIPTSSSAAVLDVCPPWQNVVPKKLTITFHSL
ncbi:hypothetical protein N0V82_003929 [Gnomoniopsis sp. IMI 355080]|nr:hypothetical protein N0V82_003929 [Gnomoniopsis sp. IMI 355080]